MWVMILCSTEEQRLTGPQGMYTVYSQHWLMNGKLKCVDHVHHKCFGSELRKVSLILRL